LIAETHTPPGRVSYLAGSLTKKTPLEEFVPGASREVLFIRVLGWGTCQIENPLGGGGVSCDQSGVARDM